MDSPSKRPKLSDTTCEGTTFGLPFKSISFRDLKDLHLIKFIKGSIFSLKYLDQEISRFDFFQKIHKIDV